MRKHGGIRVRWRGVDWETGKIRPPIWADHSLKPWRAKRLKVSNDPQFEEKLVDVCTFEIDRPAAVMVTDEP